jgi:hypothetical protein
MASHRKGATGRDYAAEYAARKARGLARGLNLPQLRGHAPKADQSVSALRTSGLIGGDSKAEVLLGRKYSAIARMSRGESLPQAAKTEGIAPSTLRRFIKQSKAAQPIYNRRGGKPTRVMGYRIEASGSTPILTDAGQVITPPAVDSRTASLLGRYWNDVDKALTSGNGTSLKKYEHTVIHTLDGQTYHLMTDLDAIRAWIAALPDERDFWRNLYHGGSVLYDAA